MRESWCGCDTVTNRNASHKRNGHILLLKRTGAAVFTYSTTGRRMCWTECDTLVCWSRLGVFNNSLAPLQ